MSKRSILLVTPVVAAVHAWLLFGPVQPWSLPQRGNEKAASVIQGTWITPEPATPSAPPAKPLPAIRKPTPARPLAQKAQPQTQPTPRPPYPAQPAIASSPGLTSAPSPAESEQDGVPAAPIADPTIPAPEALHTATPPAQPNSAPSLLVRTRDGQSPSVALPTDGSALAQHMDLQFQVHGFVKDMEYHAQARLQWQTDGQTYEAQQRISAFLLGSMEQKSQGRMTAQGFQPLRFDDRRLAKQRSALFDWDSKLAHFEPARTPASIGEGTQDRLSVFLQLAAMLQSMPPLRDTGVRITVPTLGSRKLQIWTFEVQETDSLSLPSGTMSALLLLRLPQPGEEKEQTRLWLAPSLGYVPVRIQMQEPNGDTMDFSLKNY